jgi:hypothetical protein
MRNPAEKIVKQARLSKTPGTMKEKLAAKKAAINNAATPKPTTTATIKEKLAAKRAGTAPASVKPATIKEKLAAKKQTTGPATPPAQVKPVSASVVPTPAMQKKKMVSKKTAYDIKEASNPKLKASARKNYAMNAEASMKNKKKK